MHLLPQVSWIIYSLASVRDPGIRVTVMCLMRGDDGNPHMTTFFFSLWKRLLSHTILFQSPVLLDLFFRNNMRY